MRIKWLAFFILSLFYAHTYLFAKDKLKEKPLDFTQYELKEPFKIDCNAKRDCFTECKTGWHKQIYNNYGNNSQYALQECMNRCNLIICDANNYPK